MKKKYSVHLFPRAKRDLLEIKEYFEARLKADPRSLFEKFEKQIDLLESNPFMFPLVKDPYLRKQGYRVIPVDSYLLFYIIDTTTVQIHRFIYGRIDYLMILK